MQDESFTSVDKHCIVSETWNVILIRKLTYKLRKDKYYTKFETYFNTL